MLLHQIPLLHHLHIYTLLLKSVTIDSDYNKAAEAAKLEAQAKRKEDFNTFFASHQKKSKVSSVEKVVK
eukprot:3879074-Ditylum_brightwellii.AAC.1